MKGLRMSKGNEEMIEWNVTYQIVGTLRITEDTKEKAAKCGEITAPLDLIDYSDSTPDVKILKVERVEDE